MNDTLFLDIPAVSVFPALFLAAYASWRLLRTGNYLLLLAGAYFSGVLFIGWYVTDIGIIRTSGYLDPQLLVPPLSTHCLASLSLSVIIYFAVALKRSAPVWKWESASDRERILSGRLTVPCLVLGVALMAVNRRGGFITSLPYPFNTEGSGLNAGLDALSVLLVLTATLAAFRSRGLRSFSFLFSMTVLFCGAILARLLQGERGAVLGVILATSAFFHIIIKSRWKTPVAVAGLIGAFIVLQLWASVRWTASTIGMQAAIESAISSGQSELADRDLASVQLLPQSYWHLLNVVDLWDVGVRQYGSTYFDLPAQSIPESFADLIGYVRPINSAYVLRKYREHGGGFFILAEAYWNFGLAGILGMSALLAWVLSWIENWYRKQRPIETIGYFGCLCFMVFGLAYGIQSLLRAMEIALALTIAIRYAMGSQIEKNVDHLEYATVR